MSGSQRCQGVRSVKESEVSDVPGSQKCQMYQGVICVGCTRESEEAVVSEESEVLKVSRSECWQECKESGVSLSQEVSSISLTIVSISRECQVRRGTASQSIVSVNRVSGRTGQ